MSDSHEPSPAPPKQVPASGSPRPSAGLHGILIGPFGLRAAWGILLAAFFFCVLVMVLTPLIMTVVTPSHLGGEHIQDVILNEASPVISVFLATWLLSRIESRRFSVYGLGSRRVRDLLSGTFWGLTLLSILVGALRAMHLLVFDARLLGGAPLVLYALKWLAAFFVVGVFEEYLMRGYLQFTLTRGFYGLDERISSFQRRKIAFWIAASMTSSIFAYLHLLNPGENRIGILMVFLAGFVFSYALWHTGSLWWGVGFHMAWDWAQSYLYGVPDSGVLSAGRLFQTHATGNPLLSGGTDGPEGSLLVIPILLLVIVAVQLSPRGTQPSLEPLDGDGGTSPETASAIA